MNRTTLNQTNTPNLRKYLKVNKISLLIFMKEVRNLFNSNKSVNNVKFENKHNQIHKS